MMSDLCARHVDLREDQVATEDVLDDQRGHPALVPRRVIGTPFLTHVRVASVGSPGCEEVSAKLVNGDRHPRIMTSGTDISPGAGPHNGTSALDDMAVCPEPRQLVIPVTADRAFPTVGTVTEKTSPTEPAHEQTARLVSDAMSALATAVAAAAAMVVVLAWISTWQDVHEVSRAQYLFWPLAVAAATLQVMARRIRRSSGQHQEDDADGSWTPRPHTLAADRER